MCVCLQVVPFRETPSYTKRRRVGQSQGRTPAGNGLSSPRSLIRSASDNALESPASSPGPSLQSLETHHDTHTHSLRRHTRRLRYFEVILYTHAYTCYSCTAVLYFVLQYLTPVLQYCSTVTSSGPVSDTGLPLVHLQSQQWGSGGNQPALFTSSDPSDEEEEAVQRCARTHLHRHPVLRASGVRRDPAAPRGEGQRSDIIHRSKTGVL